MSAGENPKKQTDIVRTAAVASKAERKLFQHRDRDFQIWNEADQEKPGIAEAVDQGKDNEIQLGNSDSAGNWPWSSQKVTSGSSGCFELPLVMQRLNPEAKDFQPTNPEPTEERQHGLVSNQFGTFLLPLANHLTLLDVRRPNPMCKNCQQKPTEAATTTAPSAVANTSTEADKPAPNQGDKVARIPISKSPRFSKLAKQTSLQPAAQQSPPPPSVTPTQSQTPTAKASSSPIAVVRPQPPTSSTRLPLAYSSNYPALQAPVLAPGPALGPVAACFPPVAMLAVPARPHGVLMTAAPGFHHPQAAQLQWVQLQAGQPPLAMLHPFVCPRTQ